MSEADSSTKGRNRTSFDLPAIMNQAREQYTAEREKVLVERMSFDNRLAEIDTELSKIEAYLNPAPASTSSASRSKRAASAGTGTRGPRRSGVREGVLAAIQKSTEGISRKDLLKVMDATEKPHEQSIANAVAALTKEGKITTPSKGHYKAA